jgi:3-hydroxyisobutyrate dehydrogenase-like beta-hydroxyacid dehydrogenase
MKLVANTLGDLGMQALAKAIALAEKAGLVDGVAREAQSQRDRLRLPAPTCRMSH